VQVAGALVGPGSGVVASSAIFLNIRLASGTSREGSSKAFEGELEWTVVVLFEMLMLEVMNWRGVAWIPRLLLELLLCLLLTRKQ
jgi:hypothetical protein